MLTSKDYYVQSFRMSRRAPNWWKTFMIKGSTAGAGTAHGPRESRSERTEGILRSIRVRVTPQRMIVLDALLAHPGHATADDILRRVGAEYPALNLATVYRVLDLFIAKGLVARTYLGGNAATFEFVGDAIHHHLICQNCGAVTEFDDELVLSLRAALLRTTGFVIVPQPLALFGMCQACHAVSARAGDVLDDAE
jgi:Fe2+ or Zn2+ uptake regulation protein